MRERSAGLYRLREAGSHTFLAVNAERWQQIERIYHLALEQPPYARAAFLDRQCDADTTLRVELEQLLNRTPAADRFLEESAAAVAARQIASEEPAALPRQVGRYRIAGSLGQGGMGVVYEAIDDRLQRTIALKVIREDAVGSPIARERFWREARVAARVSHPHVCQIHEVGEAGEQMFMAMERLDGEPLSARLERGAVPLTDAVRIGLEVLDALEALHGCGVVHRDLKPSNIFLTRHGVKLLDFGLARPSPDGAGDGAGSLTHAGVLVGTPKYMAPEQLQDGVIDARTDLFATGAILYEMLTGTAAFEAGSLAGMADKILHADVPVLGGSPAVAAADRVIHRALARVPANRYPSASAMADDLRTIAASPEDDARSARPVTRLVVLPFRLLRADADIDFLTFSLADAIAGALSSLESLVVRSTVAAARFAADVPDLPAIASELDVDVVLTGTLMRVGERLRASAQLVEAPAGTLVWSGMLDASVDDLFRLQDDLSRRIVESLVPPLSGRERRALGHDVPASAKAYEFYLRANQLGHDPASLDVARGLYEQAVQADPRYAPAWARLAHLYRVMGKFRGEPGVVALAETALNRALEFNPDLSLADRIYAQIEVDDGRAQDAMVRLVRRASSRTGQADLFAALVQVCRYCGLLGASLAADERASRLDPRVRTSVAYTWFMAGDFARAAAESNGYAAVGGTALAIAGQPEAARVCREEARMLRDARMVLFAELWDHYVDLLEGTGEPTTLQHDVEAILASGLRDPEGLFSLAMVLAHFGGADLALRILADVVDRGYYPSVTLQRNPWFDPLRHRHDFLEILARAEQRRQEARTAFIHAGGEALLGARTADHD